MKVDIPNISPRSGVSFDFSLAYGSLSYYLECIEEKVKPRTRFLAKRSFLHRPIPRYEELFDPKKYTDVVTTLNQETVADINKLVERLNVLRDVGSLDYEELSSIHRRLTQLVSGDLVPQIGSN